MAKYNLLDDDDIFEEEKEESAADQPIEEHKPAAPEQELEINLDDDFDIEPASLSDDEFKTDVMDPDLDEESKEVMEKEPDELDEEPHFDKYDPEEEQAPPPKETSYYTDDYEDQRQVGVNYAPFIKVFVIILILTGIYFIVDYFILAEPEEEVAEQQEPVKSPEQIQQEKEAAAKAAFLSNVSAVTKSNVGAISGVINSVQSSAKLSSVLFYGNTFLLQIFGNQRSEVARAQMSLREAGTVFELVSSETRPGSNGGILNTYNLDITGISKSQGQGTISFSSVADFETWLKQTATSNQLKISGLSNGSLQGESNFKKYEIVASLNGSVKSCNDFLQKLSANVTQVNIHKLNLSASDQRDFKPGKYQLKLILELFI